MGPALIGYDGSDHAKRAVRRAGGLFPGRPALVAHVLDRGDRLAAEDMAAEGAALASATGLDAKPLVLPGGLPVRDVLLEVADAHRADVIVLGSRGLSAVRSALLGSVSTGVLAHSSRPVLLVPPTADEAPADGPVLVGADGSEPARAAARLAGELFRGREARVVTVWSPLAEHAFGGVVGAPAAFVPTEVVGLVDADHRIVADKAAAEAAAAFEAGSFVESFSEPLRGSVPGTICELAGELGASAVVVAKRGLSTLEAALLGSVSQGVVHRAHIPVLVVPPR